MKLKHTLLALLLAFAGTAHAQSTNIWIGNNNNSLAATGTAADTYQSGGWKDITVNQAITTPDNSNPNQFNAPNVFGEEQGITVYGFGGITGLTAAEVTSALLYANISDVVDFASNGTVTFSLHGINPGLASFAENNTSWTTLNAGSLLNNYGTFTIGSSDTLNGTWVSYDVTSAFQDYLTGSIGGLAFTINTAGSTFNGNDLAVQFNSQENASASLRPGIMVTAAPIPEPSAALLLGCLGFIRLLRRARRVTSPTLT